MHLRRRAILSILLVFVALVPAIQAQSPIPPPTFGQYTVGDDYFLATYSQLQEYWTKLTQVSDRIRITEIGRTAEGRPMMMAIITSPENHKNLPRFKETAQRLARAEGLTDDRAHQLAHTGKSVVWIDGGLHATECINAQGLFTMAFQMVSQNDPETLRILNDVILLLVPVNPDGMELVSSWYMRETDPAKRTTSGLPRLYQKYVGHDNNRDSYIFNQPETEAIARQHFIEWMPQIVYNQHQTGPAGTVLFAPPFRDPFNYNIDPLVPMGIELVSASIHNRFITENKPGAVMRNGAPFSTWFNGGVRTATYFHNQIGLLTEIIGNPTPMTIPFVPGRLLPDTNQPYPIQPLVTWHQRQSIDYIMTCNRAILDVASKHREDFLYRIYLMGRNSIQRGSQDTWTLTPKRLAAMQEAFAKAESPAQDAGGAPAALEGYFGPRQPIPRKYYDMLHAPSDRDPRGYVIASDQPDFLTATKFVNALIKSGVGVHRVTAAFQVAGRNYPAGSFVVKAAQAFRPQVLDMFEPQDHPNDIPYPGGPPKPPYDATGWTLAFQMGVQFDRMLDAFDGPFEKLPMTPLTIGGGTVTAAKAAAGYLLSHQLNDAFVATSRLLAAKEDVYWLKVPFTTASTTYPPGTIYVPARPTTLGVVQKIAAETGVTFDTVATKPGGDALKLKPVRIALWDRYGGSMPSGWIRWMFEQTFRTPFEVVYPPVLDAGRLVEKYDVIIFPTDGIPDRDGGAGRDAFEGAPPQNIPDEFKDRVGSVTVAKTIPQLKQFIEDGGTVIAMGNATSLAYHLGLPVTNALIERSPDGAEKRLTSAKYYIPGSLLRAAVDMSNPLTYGMPEQVDVFYDNNPVFRLEPDATIKGAHVVAWFAGDRPLRSGWAWGQNYLKGGVVALEASLGKGKVFLFTPEITFRGQPHGTFKFLFNGIYYGSAQAVSLGRAGKPVR